MRDLGRIARNNKPTCAETPVGYKMGIDTYTPSMPTFVNGLIRQELLYRFLVLLGCGWVRRVQARLDEFVRERFVRERSVQHKRFVSVCRVVQWRCDGS